MQVPLHDHAGAFRRHYCADARGCGCEEAQGRFGVADSRFLDEVHRGRKSVDRVVHGQRDNGEDR